jgi:hypothetical protein
MPDNLGSTLETALAAEFKAYGTIAVSNMQPQTHWHWPHCCGKNAASSSASAVTSSAAALTVSEFLHTSAAGAMSALCRRCALQAVASMVSLQRDVNGIGSSHFTARYTFTAANTAFGANTTLTNLLASELLEVRICFEHADVCANGLARTALTGALRPALQAVAKRSTTWSQLVSSESSYGNKFMLSSTYGISVHTYDCPSHLAAVMQALGKLQLDPANNHIAFALWLGSGQTIADYAAADVDILLTNITKATSTSVASRAYTVTCRWAFSFPNLGVIPSFSLVLQSPPALASLLWTWLHPPAPSQTAIAAVGRQPAPLMRYGWTLHAACCAAEAAAAFCIKLL